MAEATAAAEKSEAPVSAQRIFVPRVTLSLLRIPPFGDGSAKAVSAAESSKGKKLASRILSLGRHLPAEPLLRVAKTEDASDSEQKRSRRGAERTPKPCDMTSAPGVVSLRQVEVVQKARLKTRRFKDAALEAVARDSSAAEKEAGDEREPPRVTDALSGGRGSSGNPLFAPSVDASVLSKEDCRRRRIAQQEKLEKWFGMPATELSPQLLRELQVMQLQRHTDGKNFTRSGQLDFLKSKTKGAGKKATGDGVFSAHLQVARVVDGGLRAVGEGKESQALGCFNKGSRRRGGSGSLLQSFLDSPEVARWTKKKFLEIQEQKQAPGKSGWKVERAKRRKF